MPSDPLVERNNERDTEVYEVTQLINSMLGLLIFPQQKYMDRIPKTSLAALEAAGWPHIEATEDIRNSLDYYEVDNLRDLVRYLRNGIAHFNIEFLSHNGQIRGIRTWNIKRGKKDWEIKLTLEQLRELTERFIDMLEHGEFLTPAGGSSANGHL